MKKEDIQSLVQLKRNTDVFIDNIFDWVSPLQQHDMLGRLYDFKRDIEEKIVELQRAA